MTTPASASSTETSSPATTTAPMIRACSVSSRRRRSSARLHSNTAPLRSWSPRARPAVTVLRAQQRLNQALQVALQVALVAVPQPDRRRAVPLRVPQVRYVWRQPVVCWQSLLLDLEFSCEVLDPAFNVVLAFALDFAKGARKGPRFKAQGSWTRIRRKQT